MWRQNPILAKQGGQKVQSLLSPLECGAVQAPSSKGINKQRGISLIELIMFIVIISVALAGIMTVMSMVTRTSADPLVHKQALAIAESLLEEVELMPFTYCDPDDANAASATAAVVGGAGCFATTEGVVIGNEGETRGGATPFDNVDDYAGYAVPVVPDITGAGGLAGYPAVIAVAPTALFGIAATDANGAAQVLRITVTVTGPDGIPIAVDGYRTRYSPRAVP
ncbi:MAG: type II secretion system protein [Nitrosomonadales bacterium]|nr:type II secretion system protein [Nitrosomonadales bacterium]